MEHQLKSIEQEINRITADPIKTSLTVPQQWQHMRGHAFSGIYDSFCGVGMLQAVVCWLQIASYGICGQILHCPFRYELGLLTIYGYNVADLRAAGVQMCPWFGYGLEYLRCVMYSTCWRNAALMARKVLIHAN